MVRQRALPIRAGEGTVKLELEREEAREVLVMIVDRLLEEADLVTRTAILRRWRARDDGGFRRHEGTDAKINADIDRALKSRQKSAIVKPDWR
jgi:hypothetical protein